MASRGWSFDPDSGGVKIDDAVKRRIGERILRCAEAHFAGRYTRLDIRFRGQFCYVDAYTEPEPAGPGWPPPDWPETCEEYLERSKITSHFIRRYISFGCDTLAIRKDGGGRSIATPTSGTSCQCFHPASSWVLQKRRFRLRLGYTCKGQERGREAAFRASQTDGGVPKLPVECPRFTNLGICSIIETGSAFCMYRLGKMKMTTITIQVSEDRFQKLGEVAELLGVTPEQLVQANVEDMLAQPKEEFQQALSHVLEKNEELYKRLAVFVN